MNFNLYVFQNKKKTKIITKIPEREKLLKYTPGYMEYNLNPISNSFDRNFEHCCLRNFPIRKLDLYTNDIKQNLSFKYRTIIIFNRSRGRDGIDRSSYLYNLQQETNQPIVLVVNFKSTRERERENSCHNR